MVVKEHIPRFNGCEVGGLADEFTSACMYRRVSRGHLIHLFTSQYLVFILNVWLIVVFTHACTFMQLYTCIGLHVINFCALCAISRTCNHHSRFDVNNKFGVFMYTPENNTVFRVNLIKIGQRKGKVDQGSFYTNQTNKWSCRMYRVEGVPCVVVRRTWELPTRLHYLGVWS